MTSPAYPGSRLTASAPRSTSTPTSSPTAADTVTTAGAEIPLDDDQRTLFVVTMADVEGLGPGELAQHLSSAWPYSSVLRSEDGRELDLSRFGRIVTVRHATDLDDAGIGDHVTYADDWRLTPEPPYVVDRVMAIVRETDGRLTYDVV